MLNNHCSHLTLVIREECNSHIHSKNTSYGNTSIHIVLFKLPNSTMLILGCVDYDIDGFF